MDNYEDLKEIIEKQAALNQKLTDMALELDSERAKNTSLYKEISRLKSLIGESGQELWSAENQRADRLEAELEQVMRERDAAVSALKTNGGCWECAIRQESGCAMAFYVIGECEHWKWRGSQKEE